MTRWFATAMRACMLLACIGAAQAQPAARSLAQDLATLETGRAASADDAATVQAARHVGAVASAYGMAEAEVAQPVVTATGVLRKAVPEARLFDMFDAATRLSVLTKAKGREALVQVLQSYIVARRAPNTSHERAIELLLRPGRPS